MTEDVTKAQIGVTHDGHVVVVELLAGPHNFASVDLMNELGDALINLGIRVECDQSLTKIDAQ